MGPSTSGSGGVAGSSGGKWGQDDDDDDDDPNKHRKTGSGGGLPKPAVACKEPRQKGTVYPPSQPKPAGSLHLSPKGENSVRLSRARLDPGAKEEDTRSEDAGETSETPSVQSGYCGPEGHPSLPEDLSTAHSEDTFPEAGEGDCPRLQDRPTISVSGDTVSPRGNGGVPRQAV